MRVIKEKYRVDTAIQFQINAILRAMVFTGTPASVGVQLMDLPLVDYNGFFLSNTDLWLLD